MDELIKLLEENTSSKGSFTINWNDQRINYETVEEYVLSEPLDVFQSVHDRDKCIADDVVWELFWFRNTPVGHYKFSGSSLGVILDTVKNLLKEQ